MSFSMGFRILIGVRRRVSLSSPAVQIVAGAVTIAAAILLGVFQYRWITESARNELNSEQRSLEILMNHILGELATEIREAVSYAAIPVPPGAAGVDLNEVSASVALWRSIAADPELLEAIYLYVPELDSFFSVDTDGVESLEIPERYLPLRANAVGSEQPQPIEFPSVFRDGSVVIPYRGWEPSGDERSVVTGEVYLIVEFDIQVLLARRLPVYVEAYASGYAFRVTRDERVVFVSGQVDFETRQPDVRSPVFLPLFSLPGAAGRVSSPGEWSPDEVPDPELRTKIDASARVTFFSRYLRSRFEDLRTWGHPEAASEEGTGSYLHIELYSPDRSIVQAVRARTVANFAVSYGFLVLFVIAFFFVMRIYRRSELSRVRERDFVSSMSHELRTPIAVIRSISDNLTDRVSIPPERIAEYGALIGDQSRRLGRMVESILMVSGLNQNGDARIESTPTDLAVFFDEICRTLEPAVRSAGMTLASTFEHHGAPFLTDPVALRLIVENLIMNAARHAVRSDGKPVAIRVGGKVITDLDPEGRKLIGRRLRLTVEDTGEGIPLRERRRIFDPFFRGAQTRQRQTPGSGLGLHLARRSARLFGGSVAVESPYRTDRTEIEGARFIVSIPEGKKAHYGS